MIFQLINPATDKMTTRYKSQTNDTAVIRKLKCHQFARRSELQATKLYLGWTVACHTFSCIDQAVLSDVILHVTTLV